MHLVTRLRVALVGIVAAIAIISGVSIYKPEEAQLLNVVIMGADQLSGSISGATWHAMLADRRADAYQVMEAIAVKQGTPAEHVQPGGGDHVFHQPRRPRARGGPEQRTLPRLPRAGGDG